MSEEDNSLQFGTACNFGNKILSSCSCKSHGVANDGNVKNVDQGGRNIASRQGPNPTPSKNINEFLRTKGSSLLAKNATHNKIENSAAKGMSRPSTFESSKHRKSKYRYAFPPPRLQADDARWHFEIPWGQSAQHTNRESQQHQARICATRQQPTHPNASDRCRTGQWSNGKPPQYR